MPLEDGYESEKFVNQVSQDVARAITEYLREIGKEPTTAFLLFIVDMNSGVLQHISDMNKEDQVSMIGAWLKRQTQ
jgi:hypothetical protein